MEYIISSNRPNEFNMFGALQQFDGLNGFELKMDYLGSKFVHSATHKDFRASQQSIYLLRLF
ncbi:hypothetical protein COT62_00905 [Candidatus Roizmanbacteria bacterium CG09_land_8_20_14_0_10_41_9]|uniref:Uncharacterized protein n=1 Tax=Candidatus Roizmanbacteria bacterium CG09_land_8_20_14_0_10_41_9 TaxID=1974850 RepID=A0A2H0WTM7_9BACT|nr:MAG: hypothetical protein COT62_00905 [Candidatus Roizmanbacteria bacterium CG09_land_8_20_14_0_10_41_9]